MKFCEYVPWTQTHDLEMMWRVLEPLSCCGWPNFEALLTDIQIRLDCYKLVTIRLEFWATCFHQYFTSVPLALPGLKPTILGLKTPSFQHESMVRLVVILPKSCVFILKGPTWRRSKYFLIFPSFSSFFPSRLSDFVQHQC